MKEPIHLKYDKKHLQRMLAQEGKINLIFNAFVRAVSPELKKWKDVDNKNSVWVRNSGVEKAVNRELIILKDTLEDEIKTNQREAWITSVEKNDEIVSDFIKSMRLSENVKKGMFSRNLEALTALQNRIDNGMNLSDRVWRVAAQAKTNVEFYLQSGISSGRSAEAIGRDFRQLLINPDKRFRRVRNDKGELVPSAPMRDYHPGRGVYRSARMNALRVAATETNMGYRMSDNERWRSMDFVLGFEVRRSPNAHPCPICDVMKGKYPKDFIFPGWHPFCICYAVPIVMEHADFANYLLDGKMTTENTIQDIPNSARMFTEDILSKSRTIPFFAKQNKIFLNGSSNHLIKIVTPKTNTAAELSKNLPDELRPGSRYLKGENYVFDKEFFDLIDDKKPISLTVHKKNNTGSYYSPLENKVYLCDGKRSISSPWERKAVVYHEFGHAIDRQKGIRHSDKLIELRSTQIKRLSRKEIKSIWLKDYDYSKGRYFYKKVNSKISGFGYVDQRLKNLQDKIARIESKLFEKRGITKNDVLEQIGSTRDTIMSLNYNYGFGHTKAYFKRAGMSEAEYIAHAFENTFIGNAVFEKYLPEEYKEMVQFIQNNLK